MIKRMWGIKGAAFLRHSLDDALEKRDTCRHERVAQHMNTEHVDVGPDHPDLQMAEIFRRHLVGLISTRERLTTPGLSTLTTTGSTTNRPCPDRFRRPISGGCRSPDWPSPVIVSERISGDDGSTGKPNGNGPPAGPD
jgi:hypothetical protein